MNRVEEMVSRRGITRSIVFDPVFLCLELDTPKEGIGAGAVGEERGEEGLVNPNEVDIRLKGFLDGPALSWVCSVDGSRGVRSDTLVGR